MKKHTSIIANKCYMGFQCELDVNTRKYDSYETKFEALSTSSSRKSISNQKLIKNFNTLELKVYIGNTKKH